MDIATIAYLSQSLSAVVSSGLPTAITNRIAIAKAGKEKDKIIAEYESVMNELIEERAQAISIAQAYRDEIERYTISDDDIKHLHGTISDAINILNDMSEKDPMTQEQLEQILMLVNVNSLKTMQLLGFNYKQAIGEPLTEACSSFILKKLNVPNKADEKQGKNRK